MIAPTSGALIFHIIVDDFNRTFFIDGPEGPSGVRLHYEMQQVIRKQTKKLREFDLRAESFEAALAEIKTRFSVAKPTIEISDKVRLNLEKFV
jgi:hypothetical protein